MNFSKWIKGLIVALAMVSPLSQASVVGYDVTFSNISPPEFFHVTFDTGMIFVDNSTAPGVPNVDQWMFGVNWTITPPTLPFGPPTTPTSGSSSFSGSNCLSATPTGCSSTAGLIFNTATWTLLLGQVNDALGTSVYDGTSTSGASLEFGPSGSAVFTFPSPINASGTLLTTVRADVTITPQASVPEPGTVLLLAFGVLALVVWKKHSTPEPALIRG